MEVDYYYSDDYAGMRSKDLDFYYGYEITIDEEWCFVVTGPKGVLFKMKESDISKRVDSTQLNNPNDYLIAGMGLWMTTL